MSFNRVISAVLRPVRFLVIAFTCAFVLFSNVSPAVAAKLGGEAGLGSDRSSTAKGSVQLDDIQRKSEEVTKAPPLGLQETQSEANKGINEIQGSANADQMYRPETSRQATSVEEQVKDVLENVTGK